MLKRITMASIFAAALGASLGGQAVDSGWYGGLGLGRSSSDPSGIAGAKDDKDNAWKAFGGYQLNRYFGVEGGYADLGKSTIVGTPGNAAGFESQAWYGTAVGSLPLNPQFALTGKLGLARTDTDVTGAIGGVPFAAT